MRWQTRRWSVLFGVLTVMFVQESGNRHRWDEWVVSQCETRKPGERLEKQIPFRLSRDFHALQGA